MSYTIGRNTSFSFVQSASKVCLKTRAVEGRPAKINGSITSEDGQYTLKIAKEAALYARAVLGRGTLNACMVTRSSTAKVAREKKKLQGGKLEAGEAFLEYGFLTDKLSPKFLMGKIDEMKQVLYGNGPHKDHPLRQFASHSFSARTVGAGVCNLIAAVVAGRLTTQAKSGTKFCVVLDEDCGHEYVVLSYGKSPWVVCDPWVQQVYCCKWEDNLFEPKDVTKYWEFALEETLSIPFGIEFKDSEVKAAEAKAGIKDIIKPENYPNKYLSGKKNGGSQKSSKLEKNTWWLCEQNVKKNKYGNMEPCVWNEDTNIKSEAKGQYKLIAGPFEWGNNVSMASETTASSFFESAIY
ncbi:MAG: hypothetical protein MK132_07445 [Lentisphaerales bacterium]|nr:hypothetical protein [Lentisphaerales bacterium]